MVHTTTQETLMHFVFGSETIMNSMFNANWKVIKQHKQQLINTSNAKENSKEIPHTYKVNDSVLV